MIPELIEKWHEGYRVVQYISADRSHDSFIKRFTAGVFYRVNQKLSGVSIPAGCRCTSAYAGENALHEGDICLDGVGRGSGELCKTPSCKRNLQMELLKTDESPPPANRRL